MPPNIASSCSGTSLTTSVFAARSPSRWRRGDETMKVMPGSDSRMLSTRRSTVRITAANGPQGRPSAARTTRRPKTRLPKVVPSRPSESEK